MRRSVIVYRTLEDLHAERDKIAWYWRIIARAASWLVLAGFLTLTGTYDSNAQLRFSQGVLITIIVALLAGGISLYLLLWLACPSILFRQEFIYIPTAYSSAFGFVACLWSLICSSRFNPKLAGFPVTILITAISGTSFGYLAYHTDKLINRITNRPPLHIQGAWQDAAYYPNQMPSPYYAYNSRSFSDGGSAYHPAPIMTEEEMVNHQMAQLLARKDPGPSPDASQSTFRLEWPIGGDGDDDGDIGRRQRSHTISGGDSSAAAAAASSSSTRRFLSPLSGSPSQARIDRNGAIKEVRSGSAWSRIGRAMGVGERTRAASQPEIPDPALRGKSREERRREIELGQL